MVDTVYVDLSQYVDTKPLELKKKLQEWIEEAAWYKPSLIVLDGVDKIVPPENEVRFPSSPPSHYTTKFSLRGIICSDHN